MSSPRLYGVGVGPGSPDLLTLRAVAVLRRVAVVAAPCIAAEGESLALQVAREAVGAVAGQEDLFLSFPITRDATLRRAARRAAAQAVAVRLERGLSVAFVTEGDPLIYSTFLDLLAEAPHAFPGIPIEIVPGVSAITAAGAAAAVPLADGDGKLAVLPARVALPDLGRLAREFEALVLLKTGAVLPELRVALEREGLLARALLVYDATTARQRVVRDLAKFDGPTGGPCTVLITRKGETA